MPFHSLNHFKSELIQDIFIEPADQNYLTARFLRMIGMHQDFFWHAQQTLEKLFKAGLVLNGVPVKKESHKLPDLLHHCQKTFDSDAFVSFKRPKEINPDIWRNTSVEKFVAKVSLLGSPDSRYGLVGYEVKSDDLFKLDQLTFELRRRTMGLDWIIGKDFPADENLNDFVGKTYRDYISQNPTKQIRSLKPPSREFANIGSNTEDLFHAWNFEFRRNPSDLNKDPKVHVAPKLAFKLSQMGSLYRFYLSREDEHDDYVTEGLEWLSHNVKLSKEWKKIADHYGKPK